MEDTGWGVDEWGIVGFINKIIVQGRLVKQKSISFFKESGWDDSGWGEVDDWGLGMCDDIYIYICVG